MQLDVLPGQPSRRPLKPSQASKMISIACRGPEQTKGVIRDDGMKILGFSPMDVVHGLVSIVLLVLFRCLITS
jgi:hypothetical protein